MDIRISSNRPTLPPAEGKVALHRSAPARLFKLTGNPMLPPMRSASQAFLRPGPAAPKTRSAAPSGLRDSGSPRATVCQRDLLAADRSPSGPRPRLIVADGKGFWAEVKWGGTYTIRSIASGVPAIEIVHTHARYILRLTISPDPCRDVLSIESDLGSDDPDMRLYMLLAPHLGATGLDNRAIVARHRGRHVLSGDWIGADFNLQVRAR